MKPIILFIYLVLVVIPFYGQSKSDKKPFVLKLIEKPAELKAGQTYTYVFEVRNVTNAPITLSSRCGASAMMLWFDGKGGGSGTGTGCGASLGGGSTSTNYDPVTGKFDCVTVLTPPVLYNKNDFFTLQPKEAKRFEVKNEVPKDIKSKFAMVTLIYRSEYDGSEVGFKAWTGTASSIELKMKVAKQTINKTR